MAITDDKELFTASEIKEYLSPWVRNLCAIIIVVSMTLNSLGFNSQQINAAYSSALARRIESGGINRDLEQLVLELQDQLEIQRLEILHLQGLAHEQGK